MDFREQVLQMVQKVPKGKVTTYKLLAEALGTRAYQAVGQALRHNAHPIVVPCHRVIASDGSIGGYAGKRGSRKKKELLEAEGIAVRNRRIDLQHLLFRF